MLWKRRQPDPEVQAAYDKAYKEESILAAAERGKADAHKLPAKPFYQKLGDVAVNISKDMAGIRLSDSFYETECNLKRREKHDNKKT